MSLSKVSTSAFQRTFTPLNSALTRFFDRGAQQVGDEVRCWDRYARDPLMTRLFSVLEVRSLRLDLTLDRSTGNLLEGKGAAGKDALPVHLDLLSFVPEFLHVRDDRRVAYVRPHSVAAALQVLGTGHRTILTGPRAVALGVLCAVGLICPESQEQLAQSGIQIPPGLKGEVRTRYRSENNSMIAKATSFPFYDRGIRKDHYEREIHRLYGSEWRRIVTYFDHRGRIVGLRVVQTDLEYPQNAYVIGFEVGTPVTFFAKGTTLLGHKALPNLNPFQRHEVNALLNASARQRGQILAEFPDALDVIGRMRRVRGSTPQALAI